MIHAVCLHNWNGHVQWFISVDTSSIANITIWQGAFNFVWFEIVFFIVDEKPRILCVVIFLEYSEGCYLLRRASNYAGYCLHIWFYLNLVLFGFADVYRGCDGRVALIGQTKRRNVVMFHACIWNRILEHLVSCYLQVSVYRVLWIKVRYEHYIFCRL